MQLLYSIIVDCVVQKNLILKIFFTMFGLNNLYKNLPTKLKVTNAIIFLIGLVCISFSFAKNINFTFGHLLFAIGSIMSLHVIESILHHHVLQEHYKNNIVNAIDNKITSHIQTLQANIIGKFEADLSTILTSSKFEELSSMVKSEIVEVATREFLTKVEHVARDSNNRIKNLEDIGVINVFENLNEKALFPTLKVENDTFYILRLHFSDSEFALAQEHIKDYIENKNCRFQIILLCPDQVKTIEQRQRSFAKYIDDQGIKAATSEIKAKIEKQLKVLSMLRAQLPEKFKDNLQVKVHKSHLTCAMARLKGKIIYSMYLHGKLSNEGVQFQVKSGSHLYNELEKNFKYEWDNGWYYSVHPTGRLDYRKNI